jgi:excisionase family DNA binding protein
LIAANEYQVLIYWSDEDQAYIAEVSELPGAMADGETRQAALANAEAVIQEWIDTAHELGRPIPPPHGRLMTIPEAAERLGLSVAMVRRYCSTGKLPAQKVGRDWTVRQRDVERFAASARRRGRKPADFR